MEQVVLSTAYFPPVYYFAKIVNTAGVIIENDENFLKQTYRNRCVILGANGPLSLTVPVLHGDDTKTNIREVGISYHNHWQTIHFRAIESAYRNSAFYDFYIDDFWDFFKTRYDNLLELNTRILNVCLDLIGYNVTFGYTGKFVKEQHNDFRYSISPKKELKNVAFPEYHQVFNEKFGFTPNLSILDLLFNTGPETLDILKAVQGTK